MVACGRSFESFPLKLTEQTCSCSAKDLGIASIEKLMQKRGAFDYILLETTGLADPGLFLRPDHPERTRSTLTQVLLHLCSGKTRTLEVVSRILHSTA